MKAVGIEPTTYGLKVRGTADASDSPESTSDDGQKNRAYSLARDSQKEPVSSMADRFDVTAAAAILADLPEAERRAALDAHVDALRGLPLAERAALAGRLLEGGTP